MKVTVWCAIAADCISGPYFFKENNITVKVTSECYMDLLQNFLIPELHHRNIMPANTWFQQGGSYMPYCQNCYAISKASVWEEDGFTVQQCFMATPIHRSVPTGFFSLEIIEESGIQDTSQNQRST